MNGANFFEIFRMIRILTKRVSIHFSFFELIYTYKRLLHYLYRVIDKIIMPQPPRKRRVTQGESEGNLEQIYKEIYGGQFEPGIIGFQNEDDADDDDAPANIQSDEEDEKEVVDANRRSCK